MHVLGDADITVAISLHTGVQNATLHTHTYIHVHTYIFFNLTIVTCGNSWPELVLR